MERLAHCAFKYWLNALPDPVKLVRLAYQDGAVADNNNPPLFSNGLFLLGRFHMIQAASMDQRSFRKLLSRNIGLPLGVGLLGAVAFVAVINYLLSAMQWVEHTDRVIGNANETVKLSIDMETGMRGFLITGDERFLDPYEVAKPRILGSLQSLSTLR